ncbi:glycosyltransferase family 25 protein [Epibacterium sp. Ofav1-8]|uniref:glycosyltransferase family 25 protein n=1 Tax=Epibacterium sp. Ofav1-8 TaxID=2917735 RepID=UPI001EF579EC|nr:glycosyltransferase family 25 protein [Epibacterium sp. Ofav1-8]MCG7621997.1 glycosyltransferase family 25 protein [Epibacterium sp. Ofav1-8]
MKLATYMISLDRATGRHAAMQAALSDAGLEAEFVSAVDLETTPEAELLQQCKSFGPWGVFAHGNMACTLSHAKVWEQFLASDADVALIFEDDVFISSELRQWTADLSWWPQGCDLLSLEFWRSETMKVMLGTKPYRHLGRDVAPMLSRYPGAAGYMLTRRGAEVLLAQAPFDQTVDSLLFNPMVSGPARSLTPHQITPALVTQGNTPPDEGTFLGHAQRKPRGALYRKQKRLRGMAELRALPLHLLRLISGRARLVRVTYADRALTDDSAARAAEAQTA